MTLKLNNVSAPNSLISEKVSRCLSARDIAQFNQTSSQCLLVFDKDVAMEAVKQNGLALKHASYELRDDKDVVMEAVKQNGLALEHASKDLKGSLEVTVAAIINNRDSGKFSYIDNGSKLKIMNLKEALMKSGEPGNEGIRNVDDDLINLIDHIRTLDEINQEILKDLEGVLFFVVQNGRFLQYFTDFQSNVDVVQAAVKQNGLVLAYVSEDLKSNRDVVLTAVRQDGTALEYASDDLKSDREVVMEAVKQNGEALKYASGELRADNTLVAEAKKNKKNNPWLFDFAESSRSLEVLMQNEFALRDMSGELPAGSTLVAEAGSRARDNQATSDHWTDRVYPSTVVGQFSSPGPTAGVFTIVDGKPIKLSGRP